MTQSSTGALPRSKDAKQRGTWEGERCKQAFEEAARTKPWTQGYESCKSDLATESLIIEGTMPAGLRGTFYRNGPAGHERGGQRYAHRWDGDGMVHAFRLGSDVSHLGRFVRTSKYVAETQANRMLRGAFGTYLPGTAPLPDDIDEWNAANISVCMVGSELLALWEPGSAYRLDPRSLETLGVKTWHPDLRGRAFSAHPKREPDGTLWNFGANPLTGELTLYRIGSDGHLMHSHLLHVDSLPGIHDFAITERHLVFVMSPMPVSKERLESGMSFAQASEWRPQLGTRVLVVSKADWSTRWYELPASCVFHLANAWEDLQGIIRLQMMAAANPISLLAGWTLMEGVYRHRPSAFMTLVELDPVKGANQELVQELEGEFPIVDSSMVGRRNATVLCLGRSSAREVEMPGYDELVNFDVETGTTQRYRFGNEWLVEEHLLIQDASNLSGKARWAVGTALNTRTRNTVVSVFSADAIGDGPVAQLCLPYALPLGLHGCFVHSFS